VAEELRAPRRRHACIAVLQHAGGPTSWRLCVLVWTPLLLPCAGLLCANPGGCSDLLDGCDFARSCASVDFCSFHL